MPDPTLGDVEGVGPVLIFLDVDGVLNDHRRWPNGYSPIVPELVRHLNVLLAGVPEAMIVLSSAWRYSFPDVRSIETLLCVHGCNARGRVHGATCSDADVHGIDLDDLPSFDDAAWWNHNGLTWRVGQITRYVRESGARRFVVLDDLALDVPNLIKTDGMVGLTPSLVTLAMRVLAGYSPQEGSGPVTPSSVDSDAVDDPGDSRSQGGRACSRTVGT